jgi:hypothetical protein
VVTLGLLPVALLFALRNRRRGRGDARGALRLAAVCGTLTLIAFLFRADHVPLNRGETGLLARFTGIALFNAMRVWVFYMALEPYVRRRWPHTLISWTRLLAGRFTDPLVGRDVLIGVVSGCAAISLMLGGRLAGPWFGREAMPPMMNVSSPLGSPRHIIFFLLNNAAAFAAAAVTVVVVIALIRALIRNRIASAIVAYMVLVLLVLDANMFTNPPLVIAALLFGAILFTLVLRVGLLSLFVAGYTTSIIRDLPLTFDTSSWFFGRSLLALLVLAGFAAFGFFVALGGKPLFGTPLLED